MKRSKLLMSAAKKILFEDHYNQYGSEYMSHPREQETTVPPNLPVNASEQMSTQLSADRPPIEDEDYSPANLVELSRAAHELAKQVPDSQIKFFYEEMKRLIEQAIEKNDQAEEKVQVESRKRRR
jgi:hypothetical protein